MWIQENDTVNYQNKVLKIVSIDGLYSVASNVSITLEDQNGKKIKMNYMNDFYLKYQSGEIKGVNIKKKSRGY